MTHWIFASLAVVLAADEPKRVVVPDELFIEFTLPPRSSTESHRQEDFGVDLESRAAAVAKVAFGDAIDLVGHIERAEPTRLVVVGRNVDIEFASIAGGGRNSLVPGALVRILGKGTASGGIEAEKVEIIPERDPALWAKLQPELEKFKEKYWAEAERYEDPILQEYLEGIIDRLVPYYVPDGERTFEVFMVKDASANAFALPDGMIVVHTGIMARMENEAQLASVLGHELAHVTQRHTLRAIDKSTEHKILGWGSLLASLALGMTGNGEAARGVQLMSSAWLSGYSRANEDEADQAGLRNLYLAGYDVGEAPKVWEMFQRLYGRQSRESNFFYGSHSIPRDRAYNLSHEVWKSYEPSGLLGGHIGRERYVRALARLFRENALLDLERGNLRGAAWGIERSLAIEPDDTETFAALGALNRKRGALEEAADAFQHATTLDPCNAVAFRELGFVLQRLGRDHEARRALVSYLQLAPDADDTPKVQLEISRLRG